MYVTKQKAQIEVTPEMIEAGYRACAGFDRDCFPERVMVADVISAALSAAPAGWLAAPERPPQARTAAAKAAPQMNATYRSIWLLPSGGLLLAKRDGTFETWDYSRELAETIFCQRQPDTSQQFGQDR